MLTPRAACLALLIAVPALTAAPRYTIEAKRLADHTLLIPVRVNDSKPFWCTFDSGGSRGLALDSSAATGAGLRATGTARNAGEGPAVVVAGRLSGATLVLGDLRLRDRDVVIRPIGSGSPSDCIFGAGILDSFVVEVNYAAPAVRLYEAAEYQPGPRAVSVPIDIPYGNPVISARLVLQPGQTITARLLVDTAMGQWPIAINRRFSDAQNLLSRIRKAVEPPFQAEGTGGEIGLLASRADSLSVAEFTVDNPVMMLFQTESGGNFPWDGNLGSEFFRRFILSIDYPNRRLFLEPDAELSEPASPYDGSGVNIRGTPGDFIVTRVLAEGPGAVAGLKAGDQVMAVDGIASSDLTIFAIRSKLYRTNGKCQIRVRRGDMQFAAELTLRRYL
ncbi:MAG: aspartyl protease family protein [Acidobacteriia bacterium]|nr:aspartyl protease family protein [Terriglobia bacterium]MBV8903037.1 aspartyl protease family protein [Terriglobia bacterium]